MSQENYEIIRDIAQAASHAYDGAHDADGNPVELGLKREEGNPINDSRTMDGFKVRIDGNHIIVSYQADIKLKDVYGGNFESEMDQTIGDIVAWLKKEYRKVSGKGLTLTAAGECDVMVQSTSRVRVFACATKKFKIGGLQGVEDRLGKSEDRLDNKFKQFLELGGLGSQPPNKSQKGGSKNNSER